ncbi:hypothetical protein GBD40_23060 [Salmonella enterica]|nr:hypothetical protein [Salmonella enterica]EDQ7579642.1 hypothetical protein [Salmonella enterica subsp. enterica serovar Baildon]EAM5965823.1 hypothetical protein [Salmonella enterica]EAO4173083.1 hypothetical protein [Salmonella enterica]EAO5701175.1 hypothetical protein [Salmonella enterica]
MLLVLFVVFSVLQQGVYLRSNHNQIKRM